VHSNASRVACEGTVRYFTGPFSVPCWREKGGRRPPATFKVPDPLPDLAGHSLRLESVQIGKLNRATCDQWSLRPARGQSGREKVRRLETLQGCSILLYSTTSSRKGWNKKFLSETILDRQHLLGNTVRPCLPVSTLFL
jgi:hypothetical protein